MDKTNMVGRRFGRLVVIERTVSHKNRSRWICQCDCGNKCVATGKHMREGKKNSCGCLQRESSQRKVEILHKNRILPDGQASCNLLRLVYINNAKRAGRLFNLSPNEWKSLTSSNCHYCGVEPKYIYHGNTCFTPYYYNGVDRVDNSQGYVLDNCVPCCGVCNDMKRGRDVNEFLEHIQAITNFQNSKKSAEMLDSVLSSLE